MSLPMNGESSPLPVRNERGEGWGEGQLNAASHCQRKQKGPHLPSPLLPRREAREKVRAFPEFIGFMPRHLALRFSSRRLLRIDGFMNPPFVLPFFFTCFRRLGMSMLGFSILTKDWF